MANVTVDFAREIGAMRPVHGVGQAPFSGMDFSMLHYLSEAGIPFARLHDVGGCYGRGVFVDVPNLFRNFDADPDDPASYDFAFTDVLLAELVKHGVEPFYRLGVTIENFCKVRRYYTDPPKDNLRWAKICEGIIRHYTEGWADGYRYDIRYWEIWNEPENKPDPRENQMWSGTMEEYFALYDVASKYLKARFPHLRIGGYAACGFYAIAGVGTPADRENFRYKVTFFEAFLAYIQKHGCPLDYFSWHSYDDDPAHVRIYADYVRKALDDAGYPDAESILNEWNGTPSLRGTHRHAAITTGYLIEMQKHGVDAAMFYDARFGTSIYGGMFDPTTAKPLPAYYAFPMYNELYKCGTEAFSESDEGELFVLAAKTENGGKVLLANNTGRDLPLSLRAPGYRVTDAFAIRKGGGDGALIPATVGGVLPADEVMLLSFTRGA